MVCNTVFKNKKIRAVEGQYFIAGVCVSQVHTVCENMQKRAKTCISSTYLPKNVHLKVSFTKKHAKMCKKPYKNLHLKCFWILFKTCIVKVRAS